MKNTMVIDATNNCICELVSTVNNGENRVFIEVRANVRHNPRLEIEDEQVAITESPFICEIRPAYYTGTGNLQFRIVDGKGAGDYFKIAKIEEIDGSLFLSQINNFNYVLACPKEEGCNCEPRVSALETRVDNLEDDVAALKKSVSDGKKQLAEAITSKGVQTASDDSFSTMSDNVRKIKTGSGTGNNGAISDSIVTIRSEITNEMKCTDTEMSISTHAGVELQNEN